MPDLFAKIRPSSLFLTEKCMRQVRTSLVPPPLSAQPSDRAGASHDLDLAASAPGTENWASKEAWVPRSIARVERRGDVFYFRMAVPKQWVSTLGKREIKLSLRTCEPTKSRLWGRALS